MDVIDKIAAVKTGRRRGFDDVPVEAVIMTSVHRRSSTNHDAERRLVARRDSWLVLRVLRIALLVRCRSR